MVKNMSRKKKSQSANKPDNARTVQLDDLLNDTELALKMFESAGQSGEVLLNNLGVSRDQALKACNVDSEVESCKEDLRAACTQSAWRIYGENAHDEHIDRLWKIIKQHLPTFVEVVLTAKLNGFCVAEYIYEVEDDGFITLAKIRNKSGSLDKYGVKYSGELLRNGENGEEILDTDLKYLLLINHPTDDEPAGDMTMARLFPALMLRQHGARYAMQFVKRYAQPLIVGKTAGDKGVLAGQLFQLNGGGATAIDHDDEISLLTLQGTGEAFPLLEKLANAQIQKLLLGRVKTGDLANGSRSAQETEEATRIERINAYLALLNNAISHALNALIVVNQQWGKPIIAPNGVFFEFEKEIKIDLNRANRDKIYIDAGVFTPTKEYIVEVLGIDEQYFELGVRNEKLGVKPQQMTYSFNAVKQLLTANSSLLTDEEITPTEQALIYPFLVKVFDAMSKAETAQDFQAALNEMDFSDEEKTLINQHLPEIVAAYIKGMA
ncbi:MAG: DUF935 family protein [Neisseriaceae bacterium]|nr:DUF935 family protein [Neisseriaceae bacterium]